MRPIEREIFRQTREWLHADPRNEMTLVLDEAHMYRGAGGAEVALLSCGGCSRDLTFRASAIRFIPASGSLGEGEAAERAVLQFGRDLTGPGCELNAPAHAHSRHQGEPPGCGRWHRNSSCRAGRVRIYILSEDHATRPVDDARRAVSSLCAALGVPGPAPNADLADFLFELLTGFGPLERLIELVSGRAIFRLRELQRRLFESAPDADRATASLLALATFARRQQRPARSAANAPAHVLPWPSGTVCLHQPRVQPSTR